MSTDGGKTTIGWLLHEVPIGAWLVLIGIVASAFAGGVSLSRTTLVSELLGKPSFKTREQITEEVDRRADQLAREKIKEALSASEDTIKRVRKEVDAANELLAERQREVVDSRNESAKLRLELETRKSDRPREIAELQLKVEEARSTAEERQREISALKLRIATLESARDSLDSPKAPNREATTVPDRPSMSAPATSDSATAVNKRAPAQLGDLRVQVHTIKKLHRNDLEVSATLTNTGTKTLFVFAGDLTGGWSNKGRQGLGGTATDDVGNVYSFMQVQGFTEGQHTYFNDDNLFMELAPGESNPATFILDDRSGRARKGDSKVNLNIEFGLVADLKAKSSLRTRSLVLTNEPFD